MKAHYRTKNNRITFEIEGETQKALFRGIAELQEVFEIDDTCGLCQSLELRFRVRTVDDNEYFELRCAKCNAQFSFGQHKNGRTLFPKRTDESGELPNRGWFKWKPKDMGDR